MEKKQNLRLPSRETLEFQFHFHLQNNLYKPNLIVKVFITLYNPLAFDSTHEKTYERIVKNFLGLQFERSDYFLPILFVLVLFCFVIYVFRLAFKATIEGDEVFIS